MTGLTIEIIPEEEGYRLITNFNGNGGNNQNLGTNPNFLTRKIMEAIDGWVDDLPEDMRPGAFQRENMESEKLRQYEDESGGD